ncbi:unnamed protein product [Adineta ricciae]|uniref:Uncharacterized protein n=1 Tax=Adineta ricciae TaxID=249248 RepID=A0A815DX43_ADIRI|nr:unnamed protein product [Adineta ricciae]
MLLQGYSGRFQLVPKDSNRKTQENGSSIPIGSGSDFSTWDKVNQKKVCTIPLKQKESVIRISYASGYNLYHFGCFPR